MSEYEETELIEDLNLLVNSNRNSFRSSNLPMLSALFIILLLYARLNFEMFQNVKKEIKSVCISSAHNFLAIPELEEDYRFLTRFFYF